MTLYKLMKLYSTYKAFYDFELKKVPFSELDNAIDHEGEFIID